MRIVKVIAAALWPALAGAYTVSAPSSAPSTPVKWPAMPVAVQIHDSGATSTANAVTANQTSFATWEGVSGAGVQFTVGSWSGAHMSYGSDSGNGINRVGFVLSGWPASASSALAVTFVQGGGGGTFIEEADIYFNEDLHDWSTTGQAGRFDVEAVGTHEIGHLIGIDHTPIVTATMYYATGPSNLEQRTLHPDDEEGARFLYPSPAPHECAIDGECPTVEEAWSSNVLGYMVCDTSPPPGQCCFQGGGCTGTGGQLDDPCDSDSDCIPGLQCPYDGDVCRLCDPSDDTDGLYVPCDVPAECTGINPDWSCYLLTPWEPDATCGNCLPSCTLQIDCFPDVAHCIDADGAGDMRCVPDDVTGYYRCRRFQPSQCPTGKGCLATAIGEICFDRGTGLPGEECDVDTDCFSLLCSQDGECVEACGDGWPPCPSGHSCEHVLAFGFEICVPWGAEPMPEPIPEPGPEPTPEPVPEPAPDMGEGLLDAAPEPDAARFIPAEDEGCNCAVGGGTREYGWWWLVGVAALRFRRRRPG